MPLKNTTTTSHYHRLRYMRHLRGLLKSATFQALAVPVSLLTLNAAAMCLYLDLLERKVLPSYFPPLHLGDGPFELTSFALSLLLVFRTDTSYARWNEALTTWSEVRHEICLEICMHHVLSGSITIDINASA